MLKYRHTYLPFQSKRASIHVGEMLKKITIKKHKRTLYQTKILEGMDKFYEKLIEFKKKMNSELLKLKDNQIIRLKP